MNKIINSLKKDYLMFISIVLAIITSFFSLPKLEDINWHTIVSLTMLMLVIASCTHFHILKNISQFLVNITKNQRQLIQIMAGFAFVSAMFLTNDVAIITLVPLYLTIAQKHHLSKITPVVLLTIAANLGSAITPFGNPQNIYIVSFYQLSTIAFFQQTMLLSSLSLITVFLLTFFFKKKPLKNTDQTYRTVSKKTKVFVSIGFFISLLGLLNIINLWLAFAIVIACIVFLRWQTIADIDYGLLLTFIGFFIIIGNIGRLDVVTKIMSNLTQSTFSTYLTSILSSQIISNFPSAILLSKFTTNSLILLVGSNLGGLGTLIASLANLLAFKQFSKQVKNQSVKFIAIFTLINLIILAILIPIMWLLI